MKIKTSLIVLIFITLLVKPFVNPAQVRPETALTFAIKMADSEMKQFPDASTVDYDPAGKWNYTPGLIALAMVKLSEQTGNPKYFDYAKSYADKFIDKKGEISGYKMNDYSLDKINSGKFLFELLQKTGDEKYKKAIFLLREQLKNHPRTLEGGFWHKKIYPNQMWLDGLYMEAPFYARYAKEFNEPEVFNDVINQFSVVNKHTYNPEIGLNYHGWDESKQQKWADPVTGCSPQFWGRAMGWYAMALVDVLDYIPTGHPQRNQILKILEESVSGIKKYQDHKTGLWYQVLDQGKRKGNYLESSVSAMFVYTLLKATRLNYISQNYKNIALKGYDGIIKHFVRENENGTLSFTRVCSVAGLGGDPYRPGTFEYYVGEPVRDNDPKGVGPFILASIEISKMNH